MSRTNRRDFLKTAALAAGVGAAGLSSRVFAIDSEKPGGRILGANERVRIGVAGINGRGGEHISQWCKQKKGVELAWLIDPDSRLFDSRAAAVEAATGHRPKCVQDIRKALEDKSLHAISVASCNHWHALLTFWACQHGKDVYVEKPCSHNVFEGRKCVEAARKYGCMVQHGTQSRGYQRWANIAALIRKGVYGKLQVAKAYCCKVRWSIGFKPIATPPKGLDFNLWLGPAPEQPYHENLVHYNWHWFWDTGNGDMGNQGVHEMDIARWCIPGATLPKSVVSLGGRWVEGPGFKDQGQTPNMQLCVFDFGDTKLVFETRGLTEKQLTPKNKKFPFRVDNEFFFEGGKIHGDKFFPKGKDKGEPLAKVDVPMPSHDVFKNFIDCVRSRKRENLLADIEKAHYSAALCHLGNISYRLGEEVPFSQKPEVMGDCPHVAASFKAIKDNLVGALGVNLAETKYRLGPKLAFNPKAEKFVDCPKADELLTRPYRAPFVVTDKV